MSTVLPKYLKMSPFKHVKKHQFSAQVVDKRIQRSKILFFRIQDGTLPNLFFSDEKKFDVEHYFNTQNDRVWSRNGDEGIRVVARKQCPASVVVWAVATESGRRPLFFVDQWVKLNQQKYRDNILVDALFPCPLGMRAHQKPSLVFSAGLCTITCCQKDPGVAFRECFALHYRRGMSPFCPRSGFSGFWVLVIP